MQDDIEAAVLRDCRLDERLRFVLAADVGGDGVDADASLARDRLSGRANALGVAAADEQITSFRCERAGARIAEPAAGRHHDGTFAFESEIHRLIIRRRPRQARRSKLRGDIAKRPS
jgi:hypothetical protein